MTSLSGRALNRTLLQRQHLLERRDADPLDEVAHLLGLQAQDVLPPYLSLLARVRDFDPSELSRTLEARQTVRLTLMRGTIHLVTVADAVRLRPFLQPMLTAYARRASWTRGIPPEEYDDVAAEAGRALADGPLPAKELGLRLADRFGQRPPGELVNLAKMVTPLVQVPPRGLWGRSGGQTYQTLKGWTGQQLVQPDRTELVRRYLRAYGPATARDFATWSGVTGVASVFTALRGELTVLRSDDGERLFDLADLDLASGDEPAPVRLLGKYDNVWLSHARRDRVTEPDKRRLWMGSNGGVGALVLVDGRMEGMWRSTDSGRIDVTVLRKLTRGERAELDLEVAAVERFLAAGC